MKFTSPANFWRRFEFWNNCRRSIMVFTLRAWWTLSSMTTQETLTMPSSSWNLSIQTWNKSVLRPITSSFLRSTSSPYCITFYALSTLYTQPTSCTETSNQVTSLLTPIAMSSYAISASRGLYQVAFWFLRLAISKSCAPKSILTRKTATNRASTSKKASKLTISYPHFWTIATRQLWVTISLRQQTLTSLMTPWRSMRVLLMCPLTHKAWMSWVPDLLWVRCRPNTTLIVRSIFRTGFKAKEHWDPRQEELFQTIQFQDSTDHQKLFS